MFLTFICSDHSVESYAQVAVLCYFAENKKTASKLVFGPTVICSAAGNRHKRCQDSFSELSL